MMGKTAVMASQKTNARPEPEGVLPCEGDSETRETADRVPVKTRRSVAFAKLTLCALAWLPPALCVGLFRDDAIVIALVGG